MTETDRHKKLKIAVDVMSAVSVIYALIILFPWCYYDPNFHSHGIPGMPWPIEVKLFFIDAIPLGFGVIWLTYRYGEALAKKCPFVRTTRFRLLVMMLSLAYGTIVGILLNAK
jgi:hypothetical protein